jgi:hypothetical protein
VIHQDGGQIGQHLRQPIGRDFLAKQQHARLLAQTGAVASWNWRE